MHKSAAADMSALTANIEDGADTILSSIRRPWCLLSGVTLATLLLVAGGGPLSAAMHASNHSPPPPPPPPPPHPPPPPRLSPPPPPSPAACGDGRCEPPETMVDCPADCPGITTAPECGEEPHSDPAGEAVAWGSAPEHRVSSASECCARCKAHAADPRHASKPCNSWVFCYLPHCWSLDSGNVHTFGECWLKWQVRTAGLKVSCTHPQHGARGTGASFSLTRLL